jgi:hypothetical protein
MKAENIALLMILAWDCQFAGKNVDNFYFEDANILEVVSEILIFKFFEYDVKAPSKK